MSILILAVGALIVPRFINYNKHLSITKNLTEYQTEMKKYISDNNEIEKYCMRNSLKYSKGSILCSQRIKFSTDNMSKDTVLTESEKIFNKLGWIFRGDASAKDSDEPNSKLYNAGFGNCYIDYMDVGNRVEFIVGCSGAAKMEYFPVRE